jgi:hypothetical protein
MFLILPELYILLKMEYNSSGINPVLIIRMYLMKKSFACWSSVWIRGWIGAPAFEIW